MRDGMEILVRSIDPPACKTTGDPVGVPLRYALVRPGGPYKHMVAAFAMHNGELGEWNYDYPLASDKSVDALMEKAKLATMPLADFPDPPPGWTDDLGCIDEWRGCGDPALCWALRLLLLNDEETPADEVRRSR